MRPRPVPALLALLVGLAALPVAADASDDPPGSITATVNFELGSSAAGGKAGFLAPGGHFDVGFRVRRWRLAAELDAALWSNQVASDALPESGSFRRGGMALRWTALEMTTPAGEFHPGAAYRIFVEGGIGHQRIEAPGVAVGRNDVMIGLGIAPELSFGRVLFGTNFGVRALISSEPGDALARSSCTDCRASARHELTMLFSFGFTIGR